LFADNRSTTIKEQCGDISVFPFLQPGPLMFDML
jgi:hypothetical protein